MRKLKGDWSEGMLLLSFGAESFAFQFVIKNIKKTVYKIIILPVDLYRCATWSHTAGRT